jgi:uncharacterized membrane protein
MSAWLRAFHIIGLILWMGGLFQLARHLAYHADLSPDERPDSLADWESKTYYFTVLPGLLLALLTGLYAMISTGFGHYLDADGPWGATFHAKLLFVVILLGADQFVHFKMRSLHKTGEGSRGPFMAVHCVAGWLFIATVFIVVTQVLA